MKSRGWLVKMMIQMKKELWDKGIERGLKEKQKQK